jgi:lactate dehydrogenase-like 2-hydroxyacid dehydrogenase
MTGDRQIRSRQFSGWHPTNFLGKDFHHSRLGIIGFGNIGQAIARRARGFAVEIVYYDIQRPAAIPAEKGVRCISDLDALLAESDFIIVAADFRPENHHLLGPRELGLVKRDCLIVNISRGSLVDEQAIAAALQSGRLGGYAADVFAFEDRMIPGRPDYIPDELLNQPDRTVFTPHLGTGTVTTRENLSIATARQLLAALRGQLPPGAVNGVQPGKMLL